MATEKLYYDDSYTLEFDARVVERRDLGKGKTGLVLDRTFFYPTSGGQPHDTGYINNVPVVDVYEEGELIVHVLSGEASGDTVHGKIDWERRFDHMQQHTGQHILSQAFVEALGAETVSFHLGQEMSSIDLAGAAITTEQAMAVEDLANQVVFANRPISAAIVSPERLAALPLRKPPTVTENVRIVEVSGFDWSPCGGTHCRAAGEVGIIKIRRLERRGAETRVEFLCGRRALLDYRWKNEHILALAGLLSARDREAVSLVARMQEEAKERDKQIQDLRDELLGYEAETLLREAERVNGVAVVARVFPGREAEELKRLAFLLTAGEKAVALLAGEGRKGHLLFARTADVDCDMAAVLRAASAIIGGRGGGQPAMAQGGVPEAGRLREVIDAARAQVEACLS